jgi:hypothetical protein
VDGSLLINPRDVASKVCSIARRVHGMASVRAVVWDHLVGTFSRTLIQSAVSASAVGAGAGACADAGAGVGASSIGGGTLLGYLGLLDTAVGAGLYSSVEDFPAAAAACFKLHAYQAEWKDLEASLRFIEDRNFFLSGVMLDTLSFELAVRLTEFAAARSSTSTNSTTTHPTVADVPRRVSSTAIPFERLAKVAELLAASNTLSPPAAAAIGALARQHIAERSVERSGLDPRLLAMWCLHMAGAGLSDESVFDAVATEAVRRCEFPNGTIKTKHFGGSTTIEALVASLNTKKNQAGWPVALDKPIYTKDAGGLQTFVHQATTMRDEVEAMLTAAGLDDGRFLVREHKDPGRFILSVIFKGKPTHHQITTEDGKLTINMKNFGSAPTIEARRGAGGKERWIKAADPPVQSWRWLAKIGTLLASAGVSDPSLFVRLGEVRCAFFDRNVYLRISLVPTPARLK